MQLRYENTFEPSKFIMYLHLKFNSIFMYIALTCAVHLGSMGLTSASAAFFSLFAVYYLLINRHCSRQRSSLNLIQKNKTKERNKTYIGLSLPHVPRGKSPNPDVELYWM